MLPRWLGGYDLGVRISIVIATYNRDRDLRECLSSIYDSKIEPYEVIVVDSNSSDDTKKLKVCFPIKFVSIDERNRQCARNVGISIASGDVVAFLDDDVVVDKNWLNYIAKPYVDNSIGGVGGRVIPYGVSERFYVKISRNEIGRVFTNGLVIGNFDFPAKDLVKVDSFIGCNMSFRREILLKVGGFDENYTGTGYRDDTDLCMRIRRLGYKLVYNSRALVWHKFKGKNVNNEWVYWYIRNHVYFYFKNIFAQSKTDFPLFLYYLFFPPRDYILKSGVKLKITPSLMFNVFRGIFDGYKTWRKLSKLGKHWNYSIQNV